eukprot:NODE_1694_length_1411_cov_33.163551_g1608_i0.p1 GENE.NODE_1694_length_1411_cov_33.163551_g1608_i0~~NODE_1694_length_1411_cov_33.163551_g1608_i0.p1  ORF type:complete len:456 (+),score=120.68 NODE_1694_length_1411_cov_33.163551_g1608_i0:1-1368(+)
MLGAVLFLRVCCLVGTTLLTHQSFIPPFDHQNEEGERTIKGWVFSGSASVHQHFVRLTPDRLFRRGAMHTVTPFLLQTEEFSALFKFRIAGKDPHDHGEGLCLWVTDKTWEMQLGLGTQFKGIGIVFDSYHTPITPNHKDISIYYNDGMSTERELLAKKQGCNVPLMRYHTQRADVGFQNTSVAMLVFRDRTFSLHIDPLGSGDWTPCAYVTVKLDADWLQHSRFAVTGTTGTLTNNHDALSLLMYDSSWEAEAMYTDLHHHRRDEIKTFIESWEHAFVDVKETIHNALHTLQTRETRLEQQITQLEERLKTNVFEELDSRLDALEEMNVQSLANHEEQLAIRVSKFDTFLDQHETGLMHRLEPLETQLQVTLSDKLERRLQILEERVRQSLDSRIARLENVLQHTLHQEAAALDSRWGAPFFVILFAWAALLYIVISKLQFLAALLLGRTTRNV